MAVSGHGPGQSADVYGVLFYHHQHGFPVRGGDSAVYVSNLGDAHVRGFLPGKDYWKEAAVCGHGLRGLCAGVRRWVGIESFAHGSCYGPAVRCGLRTVQHFRYLRPAQVSAPHRDYLRIPVWRGGSAGFVQSRGNRRNHQYCAQSGESSAPAGCHRLCDGSAAVPAVHRGSQQYAGQRGCHHGFH